MAVSNQTKIALAGILDVGVDKEITTRLGGNFGTDSVTCANVTAATGTISSLVATATTIVGTASGTFGGVSITAAGVFLPSYTTTTRDALGSPAAGQVIFNTTSSKLNFYNGAAWEVVTSAVGA